MRMISRAAVGLFAVGLFTASTAQTAAVDTLPSRVIIIRHGEKPRDQDNHHLSKAGQRRAKDLVAFIGAGYPKPIALFATRPSKKLDGIRTRETLEPLARKLAVSIQTPFESEKFAGLAKEIRTNRRYAGKTILICWTHDEIPDLAAALGVRPKPARWKSSVFDRVYVITYSGGKATLSTTRYGAK